MENQDVLTNSTGHKNKTHIKLQLQEYQKVLQERDHLLKEVDHLKKQISELNENIEFLKEEHAEELAVLSSSFSQHFETEDDNNNQEKIKEYEREIQKLKNSIEDKNYHINQLQRKLMKTQVEMEKDLENHEAELENLRSQLEKLQNSDTESLIEHRMSELKENYEKEITELKARLETEEQSRTTQTKEEQTKDEQLNNTIKEVDELKQKLKTLEDTMDERLQEEETKFRREVMSVKDKLIHQHQLEIDELLSQLERSNAEVEKLRRLSRQSDHEEVSRFQHVANGEVVSSSPDGVNGLKDGNDDSQQFELARVNLQNTDSAILQELETIHDHYQHQLDFMKKRIKEQYQQDLDESIQKVEENNEVQLEKQRSDYEEKIIGIQRQLRTQFQTDLERVTNDMEEQILVLKDGHSEEIAELMMRVRGLSEERRRSYIEQDNTQQHVIVIKEEFKSKVESLEQELRAEKEKVAQYESRLESVDAQIQAFKAEKEQEVKYIEEELKKQCKSLVEKKTKEVKERYQSELNEKVNKVEKALKKQYDEETVRTRSELEESHRTLKEKYDNELSDMMTQMEQVQQRNQEVYEAQQKEHFEKQLSIVKEEFEPFKDKCQNLENENKALLEKYNKDLSELKLKMDEVENRYSSNEKIEKESLRTLEDELGLYKTKVKELEEGNQMLVQNYGAQLENIKAKYENNEESELKTLQQEVIIYTKKVEKLEEENTKLAENYNQQIIRLTEDAQQTIKEKEELSETVHDLSNELKLYMDKCSEMEESKNTLDNLYAEDVGNVKEKVCLLNKDLEHYRNRCSELEELHKIMKKTHSEEKENMQNKVKSLSNELDEMNKNVLNLQKEKARFHQNSLQENDKLREKLAEYERTIRDQTDDKTNQMQDSERVHTLTNKINELENTVHQLEEVATKNNKEKEDLVMKIENQRILIKNHERDLETANTEKVNAEERLKNVSDDLQSSRQAFENFRIEKDAIVEGKNNTVDELFKKIDMLQDGQSSTDQIETKKLRDDNNSLKSESKRLKMFLESLRAENHQLLDEMQTAAGKQKQQMKDVNEELTSVREENVKLTRELDRVKERYELLIVDLKDEIENQKKTLKELELSNSQYAKEIASLVQEMERRQSKVSVDNDIDNSNSLEDTSCSKEDEKNDYVSKDESTQKLYEEIDELKAQNEQFRILVQELEDEGDNKFGVLLSQHEKELEVLKEELEDQIARKREQLAQEAAAKRQKLKEEYESKLRVIYDELVSERARSKEHLQQINQLGQKVKLLEGINSKQKKDIERMKEDKAKDLERQAKKKDEEAEKDEDVKINIKTLEDKLLELRDRLVQSESSLKEKDEELTKAINKIKSLETKPADINERMAKDNSENDVEVATSESGADKVLSTGNGINDSYGEKAELMKTVQRLENDKSELENKLKEFSLRNEKLQKDLQNMDKAKEVVIQMYDEKMETLAIELDDSSERCDVLRKQLEVTKKILTRKEKEVEEKQKMSVGLKSQLQLERDTNHTLKEKLDDLENQLQIERTQSQMKENGDSEHLEELRHTLNTIETDLLNERDLNTSMTQTIEEQKKVIASRDDKLVKITEIVNCKDSIIAEKDDKISKVEEELILEKKKSSDLEHKLLIFKNTDGTTDQRMEQLRVDLNEVHEKNNQLLKQNYENILNQQMEEHRVRTDEFEAEIVTLKGMVDNLEQLIHLKDEDLEIQLKETDEKRNVELLECQGAFEKERQQLNDNIALVTKENDSHKTRIHELSLQVREFSENEENQKKMFENEIKNLRKQIDFENSFQVELQEGFQTELQISMEKQQEEHKRELENVNAKNVKDLQDARNELSTALKELDSTKEYLKHRVFDMKTLEDKSMECKVRHEEEIMELTTKIDSSSKDLESCNNTTIDSLVLSLRNDKKHLEDEVKRLQDIIQDKDIRQREDIDLVKGELERRFHEQREEMNKHHTEELGGLMMRLQTLVRQESDSKALIKNHMDEIDSVRTEMVQRVAELNHQKEREIEATRREIGEHYQHKLNDLEDQLNSKCKEVKELQNSLRSIAARSDQLQSAKDELHQLRRENSDLYKALRESSSGGDQEKRDRLKSENQSLKQEIESYKKILQRKSPSATSESSGERSRLFQLMKVMEQIMSERNDLELKLREEILDLKTRFSKSGYIYNSPSELDNISSFSGKVTRESLISMLQEFRSNKNQQEQDIQVHIREIESMIEDIKVKIRSTECADAKIQEMLAKQLQHLDDQRRILVKRLWDLREKHDRVAEKLTRQITAINSSPGDEIKSKLYQNLLEENLKKEKEQLLSKQQQVNDLRRKLSVEKALMDRRVAERQRLQQQLSEKDRQENELSTERQELQKRWRDKLRVKELELKQEKFDIDQKHSLEYRDSVAARIDGLISRSTDNLSRIPQGSGYSRLATEKSHFTSLNRHCLQSEARKPTHRQDAAISLTEYTHFRPYDDDKRFPTNRYHWLLRDDQLDIFGSAALGSSFLKNGFEDFSDEDLHSSVLSNLNEDVSSLDIEDKLESDIDSFVPLSADRLTGMEKEWERNLEEELKQISAGTLKIFPSGKIISKQDGVDPNSRRTVTRTQSDPRQSTPSYGQTSYEVSSTSSFEKSRLKDEYPRSSTAIPGDDDVWMSRNGSFNLSQIPTVLPTLLNDITKERDSRKGVRTPIHQRLAYSASKYPPPKDQAQNSNSSNSSNPGPISRIDYSAKHSADSRDSKSHSDHSNVYLINMDDYIDRHRVVSSDVVASLRDLSPSERYPFC